MTTELLKKEFHELIDKIDNNLLLEQFYKALNYSNNNSKFDLWDSLSDQEKEDVLVAFEESKNENNLINFDDVKKKHSKWLSK
jgi:hypothetical protein